jgi:hypothetical protein
MLEAAEAMVAGTAGVDWNNLGLMVVHRSAGGVFIAVVENGAGVPFAGNGREYDGDIALHVAPLSAFESVGATYDHAIPVMLCAEDLNVCVGIEWAGLKRGAN